MPATLVRDRVVLIGSEAESLKDTFYTAVPQYARPLEHKVAARTAERRRRKNFCKR